MRSTIAVMLGLLPVAPVLAGTPTTWVTSYGAGYEIRFNDWGYTGPAGVGANDFRSGAASIRAASARFRMWSPMIPTGRPGIPAMMS